MACFQGPGVALSARVERFAPYPAVLCAFFALLAAPAQAGASSEICARPLEGICHSEEMVGLRAIAEKNIEEARLSAARAADETARSPRPFSHSSWPAYVAALDAWILSKFGLTQGELSAMASDARTRMAARILLQGSIPEATRSRMVAALEEFSLVSASEFITIDRTNRGRFSMHCENDGMERNGFFFPSQKVFVICPGWLISALTAAGDRAEMARALQFVIAHELAHRLAHPDFSDANLALVSCLKRRDLREIFPLAGERSTRAKVSRASSRAVLGVPEHSAKFVEIISDLWAIEVMAEGFVATGASPPEVAQSLKRAFSPMCVGPALIGQDDDDPVHPPLRYRLGTTVGRHPRIRALLGCELQAPQPKTQAACTI